MKVARTLDLSMLPELTSANILSSLSRAIDEQFKEIPELREFHERSQAALMFFCNLNAESESWRNEAFIRAGLNEFYSLEDAARRGFRVSHSPNSVATFSDSQHPLIHIMYTLRHINVHIKPSPTRNENIIFTLRCLGREENFTNGSVMLADQIKYDILGNADVRKYYSLPEIERTLDWLLINQLTFGISEVFRIGTEAYCREVLTAFA